MKKRTGTILAITVSTVVACLLALGGAFRPGDAAAGVDPQGGRGFCQAQQVRSSPCAADIDGNGKEEILVGDGDFLRCLNCDGTERWSVDTGDWVGSSPAAWDVDGDGRMEIFVGNNSGYLWGFDYRGKQLSEWGWPKKAYEGSSSGVEVGVFSSPSIGDIDGDDDMEVVVGSWRHMIWAWHYQGPLVAGYPVDVRDSIWSSPAIGDVNGDGLNEVVIGADCSGWMYPKGGLVYVLNGVGQSLPGWPKWTPQVEWSSPALADLDGDGYLDIVIGSGHFWPNVDGQHVYAWDYQGNSLPGWPVETDGYVFSSPAVGDVSGDGGLEVVALDLHQKSYEFSAGGNLLGKKSWASCDFASPALGDTDGDGKVDIVYDVHNAPALGDFDDDGKVEIAYNRPGPPNSWVAQTGATYHPGKFPWPMFRRDCRHTGCYGEPDPTYPSTFYFAEGYTADGFQEYLCVGNRGSSDAEVELKFMFSDRGPQYETVRAPAGSRITIDVNDMVGAGREVSVRVRSRTAGLVVERPVYFNYAGVWPGGHDVVGATATSNRWYFAEGTTLSGFEEYITVQNPQGAAATLTFTYMPEGQNRVSFTETVGANSRATFRASDHVGAGRNISLLVESDAFVVAERIMYFDYHNMWRGGHCVVGSTSPAKEWYFAEGTTREGFDEWLCIQNPNTEPMTVEALFTVGEGQGDPIARNYQIPDMRRLTVSVNDVAGPGKDVSIKLISDYAFIAERPMYFNYQGKWSGGHDVLGANAQKTTWLFAEGYTGPGFEEWLCIQNARTTDATVKITYYPESGKAITRTHHVSANTRYTVNVNADAGANQSISAKVESDLPVICERPMYFNYNGIWPGGHDVVGY